MFPFNVDTERCNKDNSIVSTQTFQQTTLIARPTHAFWFDQSHICSKFNWNPLLTTSTPTKHIALHSQLLCDKTDSCAYSKRESSFKTSMLCFLSPRSSVIVNNERLTQMRLFERQDKELDKLVSAVKNIGTLGQDMCRALEKPQYFVQTKNLVVLLKTTMIIY